MAEKKIGARIVLEGEKQFQSAVTACQKSISQMKSEMKLVEVQTQGSGKSLESLQKRHDALTHVLDAQVNKQDAVAAGLAHAQADYQRVGSELGNYRTQLSQARAKLDEMRKSGTASEEEMAEQEKVVADLTERVKLGERAYETAGKRVEQWEQKLNKAEIETAETTAKLQNLSKELDAAAKAAADERFNKLTTNLHNASTALDNASKALAPVSAAAGVALAGSVKLAADYETSMAKVSTIADTSVVSMGQMSDAVLDMSNQTGIAATEIAESVYSAISAGQDTADAVQFVGESTKLAKAGFSDAGVALDVLTTIMNAYGLSADQVSNVSDRLIAAQNLGKTTVAELGSSMGKVIPTANMYGVNLDNIASAYVTTTKNGIATAESTTYINSMLNELGKSGSKVSQILIESTGKSFKQLMDSGYSLTDVLGIVSTEASNSGKSIGDMFGSQEAGKAAATLIQHTEDFDDALKQMNASVGATDKAFEKVSNTSAAQFNKNLNLVKNAGIQTGQAFLNTFAPAIESAGNAVQGLCKWFDGLSSGGKEVVAKLFLVTAAAAPAAKGMSMMAEGAAKALEVSKPLIDAYQAEKAAVEGLTVTQGAAKVATDGFEASMNALNTTLMAHPAAIVVGSLAALAAVMVTARNNALAANEGFQSVKNASEDIISSLEGAQASINATFEEADKSLAQVDAQADIAGRLIEQLEGLASKSDLTAEEQAKMQACVSQLNTLFPEMGLAIEESTGKLNMSADGIKAYVASAQDLLKIKAYGKAAEDGMNALVEAEADLATAREKQKDITDEVAKLQEAYNQAVSDAESKAGAYGNASSKVTAEVIETGNALQQAKEKQEEVNAAVETAQAAYDEANGKVSTYIEKQQELAGAHSWAADSTNSMTDATNELADATEASISVAGQEREAFENLDGSMREVAMSVAESVNQIKQSVQESVESQMNMFEEFNAGTELSTQKMLENMQSQVDGVTQWEQNLAELAEKGINQDLLQHLAEMGPQGAGYVDTFNSMTSDELAQANDLWNQSLDIQGFTNEAGNQLIEAVGTVAAGGQEQFQALGEQLNAATNEAGNYTVQGLVDGINAAADQAGQAGEQLGQQTIDGTNRGLGCASPSTKTRQSGMNVGQGLQLGITASIPMVQTAANLMGTRTIDTINRQLGTSGSASTKTRTSGMNVAMGLANGLRAGIPSVMAAAQSLAQAANIASHVAGQIGAAYSAGYNISAGLANGISAGRSAVVNAAASVAASAVAAAKSTLGERSPSRVFREIGEYADEGFILGIEGGAGAIQRAVSRTLQFNNPMDYKTSQAGYANAGGNYNMLVAAFTEALRNVDLNINYNKREFARVIAAAGG